MPAFLVQYDIHLDVRGLVAATARLVLMAVGVGDGVAEDIDSRARERRSRLGLLSIEDKVTGLAVRSETGMLAHSVSRHRDFFDVGSFLIHFHTEQFVVILAEIPGVV